MELRGQNKNNSKETQIGLGLKKSRFEGFYKFRRKMDYYETVVSLTSLWRSSLFWIVVCIDILIFGVGAYLYQANQSLLPGKLPVFFANGESLFITEPWKVFVFLSIPLLFDIAVFVIGQGIVGRLKIIIRFALIFKIILAFLFIIFLIQVGLLFLA